MEHERNQVVRHTGQQRARPREPRHERVVLEEAQLEEHVRCKRGQPVAKESLVRVARQDVCGQQWLEAPHGDPFEGRTVRLGQRGVDHRFDLPVRPRVRHCPKQIPCVAADAPLS